MKSSFMKLNHVSTFSGKGQVEVNKKAGPTVLITEEVCDYLRISRPTFLKYLYVGRIKATRAGRGWRVLKSELDRFLQGEMREKSPKESLVKEGRAISDVSPLMGDPGAP
jgi:excisionase family DNA binding protein